jgi:hypothetical protein
VYNLRAFMAFNISKVRYVACWTEDDGIYFCGHKHTSVADAMQCLVPNGGSFIRACEAGVFRSLNELEYFAFLQAVRNMPWSLREKA